MKTERFNILQPLPPQVIAKQDADLPSLALSFHEYI